MAFLWDSWCESHMGQKSRHWQGCVLSGESREKVFSWLSQLLESVHSVHMFEMWFIHLKWGFKLLNVEANQTSAWDWHQPVKANPSCKGFIHEGIICPTCQCDSHPGNSIPAYLQVTPGQKVCCQPKLPLYIYIYGWVKMFRVYDHSPGLFSSSECAWKGFCSTADLFYLRTLTLQYNWMKNTGKKRDYS